MMTTERPRPTNIEDILGRVREVVDEVVAEEAEVVDREGNWPEASIRALQAAGLGGLVAPRESGGLGQGLYALIRVCEAIGQACASSALCYGMHCVGTAVIAAKATQDQQCRYLEPISRGEHLTTLALSEPETGAHFYYPQTQLERVADEAYRVTGIKSFVTNGGHADSYVLSTVAADPGRPIGEFSCVVLREGTEGMVWGPPWVGLGMRGNASRRVELDGVRVPQGDLLGEEGDQIWYIFHIIAPSFLSAMSGTYLGVATAALEEARAYLAERSYGHSGRTLSQLPVLQHRLGTLWGKLEGTRRLVYYAGREADAGGPNALPALCSAKAEVADCVVEVVNEAMTLMGGIAYSEGGKMGRLLRDARASHIMAPTTDMLRTWTGRALLGHPILGD